MSELSTHVRPVKVGTNWKNYSLKVIEKGIVFEMLVNPRLPMVITRWRDLKTLQIVSTVMKHGNSTVQRRVGSKIYMCSLS